MFFFRFSNKSKQSKQWEQWVQAVKRVNSEHNGNLMEILCLYVHIILLKVLFLSELAKPWVDLWLFQRSKTVSRSAVKAENQTKGYLLTS